MSVGKIRQQDLNRIAKGVKTVENTPRSEGGAVRRQGTQTGRRSFNSVSIYNATGVELPPFSVLRIDRNVTATLRGITQAGDADAINLEICTWDAEAPDSDLSGVYAVLQTRTPAGRKGSAIVSGVTKVKLDDSAPGLRADPIAGNTTKMVTNSDGLFSVMAVDVVGSSDTWGYVRLGGKGLVDGAQAFFGKLKILFNSGSAIAVDPCDVSGVDNGMADTLAFVQADRSSYSMTNSTTLAVDTVVACSIGADGNWYMLGQPIEVMTAFQVDGPNKKLQKKTRNTWGQTSGTESDWFNVHTGGACP